MSGVEAGGLDLQEQRARIDRAIEGTRKFAEEQRKLAAEASKLSSEVSKLSAEQLKVGAEQLKFSAEQLKLSAEQLKLERDRWLAPWQLVLTTLGAGAALFAAGAGFLKLLHQ